MGCSLFVIDDWNLWMILLLYETCVVWRPEECEFSAWNLYVYMWNVITDDVDVYDNVDMRWWCWDDDAILPRKGIG